MGLFSKAADHGLAALIDIRCSQYVRSSINRTGAADPDPTVKVSRSGRSQLRKRLNEDRG